VDSTQSSLWVVSMNRINFNSLKSLLQRKPTYSRVVAFQPTGWTLTRNTTEVTLENFSNQTNFVKLVPKQKDGNSIYSVPYSEHSSFHELVQCVRTFRYPLPNDRQRGLISLFESFPGLIESFLLLELPLPKFKSNSTFCLRRARTLVEVVVHRHGSSKDCKQLSTLPIVEWLQVMNCF
jgi:hypothetical protein